MSAELPLDELPEKTPLCTAASLSVDPQADLLAALRDNKLSTFTQLAQRDDVDVDHFYGYPDNTTCLQAAVDEGKHEFLNTLLRARANPNMWNPVKKITPLHQAVQKFDDDAVTQLLAYGADVSTKNGKGRTPLHVLAERAPTGAQQTASCERIVRALLARPAVDVNAEDRAGCTALYLAAVSGADLTARYLLSNGGDPGCTVDGRSAREMLQERGVSADPQLAVTSLTGRSVENELYEALVREDLAHFRTALQQAVGNRRALNASHGNYTCLQYACDNGLYEFVEPLLAAGADPAAPNPNNQWTPLHYAAARGYHRILRLLVHHEPPPTDLPDIGGETLLHKLVRAEYRPARRSEESDHALCLEELVSSAGRLKLDVNAQDKLGFTPLHHAVSSGNLPAMQALLRLGANIGIKNRYGDTPVKGLPPDVLHDYLDECVTCNDRYVTDNEFKIDLCYSFLAPRRRNKSKSEENEVEPLPETESLWYMAQSKRHRHLLKHPVISSFLDLKWQKIRKFFAVNLAFYTVFVAMMTAFIFLNSAEGGRGPQKRQAVGEAMLQEPATDGGSHSAGYQVVFYISAAMVVLLIIREIFQFLVAPRRYIFTAENLLEISMLAMASVILFSEYTAPQTLHLSSLVILLSWGEFFMLLGRLPLFSIYVTMFTTVLFRFIKILMWYFVLILAFAISMYIIFKGDEAFPDPASALIKTLVMTIGEMDYGDLPIRANTPTAQLVFVAFLFLITIVLMNLLNGLAVADTGEIQHQAQIYGYVGRVELISYIESTLLGDPFHFLSNYPPFKWLQRLPDCAPCGFLSRISSLAALRTWCGDRTLLFFNALPNKNLTVFPNRRKQQLDPATCRESFSLDGQIIDDAKSLVVKKRLPSDDLAERMARVEAKLDQLLSRLAVEN